MGRPLRIEYPGACYHVTARGNERKKVFWSKWDREKFFSYLESSVDRYGAVFHAYCLMDNHYHLLVETPGGNLSQVMQHINGAYTNYFNAKRRRVGHLFQGRYKAILVEADEYALELSRYLHLNPVRAGLAQGPDNYSWSSYRDYVGLRQPPPWLTMNFIHGLLGVCRDASKLKYRQFVEGVGDKVYSSPLEGVVAGTILGREEFVAEIQERHVDMASNDRDLPALRQFAEKPGLDLLAKASLVVFGDDKCLAKKAGIYLCHRHTGAKLREIGEHFGLTESAVSQVCRRFRLDLDKGVALRKKFAKLVDLIGQ